MARKSERTTFFIQLSVVVCTGICILFIQLFGVPSHRGFFCNDQSIKYPYKPHSTVPNLVLVAVDILYPAIAIFIFEIIRNKSKKNHVPGGCSQTIGINYSTWQLIFGMLFGLATTFVLTDAGKYLVGSLRPNFLAICKPDFSKINCSVGYVTNYTCMGTVSARILRDARLSFPSGHASTSAYSMVFTAIYLESIWIWPNTAFIKSFLQGLSFLFTWLCALTRIHDYRHRWLDVITGFLLGIAVAFYTALSVLKLFENEKRENNTTVDAITFVEGNAADLERKPERIGVNENHDSPL